MQTTAAKTPRMNNESLIVEYIISHGVTGVFDLNHCVEHRQAVGAIFVMRTADQYREFAAQCYRQAAEAKSEAHRKMMEEMARAWGEVAEEAEERERLSGSHIIRRA